MFEQGNARIVRSISTSFNQNAIARPSYEQFKVSGPECYKFGDDGIIMLRDAIYSLFRHMFSEAIQSKLGELGTGLGSSSLIDSLVDASVRYASIYYRCGDAKTKEGVMQLLRSCIADRIRGYKPEQAVPEYVNNFIEMCYTSVREVIRSGD